MGKKILIVEDEPDVIDLLEQRLSIAGYDIVSAMNGRVGLEKARTEKPDLILLDIILPIMDGFDFVRTIKNDSALDKMPIIVLTARGRTKESYESIMDEVDDFIVKPYDPEDLLSRIQKVIGE